MSMADLPPEVRRLVRDMARDARQRLAELAESTGCEAGAARSYERGRLSVLTRIQELDLSACADCEAELSAARTVLADRERELMEIKGPCSNESCRSHYAHSGPCDERESVS